MGPSHLRVYVFVAREVIGCGQGLVYSVTFHAVGVSPRVRVFPVQLLSEEYSLMSPSTLENLGFFVREGENGQEGLSETQKKMSGTCMEQHETLGG